MSKLAPSLSVYSFNASDELKNSLSFFSYLNSVSFKEKHKKIFLNKFDKKTGFVENLNQIRRI
jgi:hypothetical protein